MRMRNKLAVVLSIFVFVTCIILLLAQVRSSSQANQPGNNHEDLNRRYTAGQEISIDIGAGEQMTFCWIPGGETQLGSTNPERHAIVKKFTFKEEPEIMKAESEFARGTFRTKGFWLGKYPVSQTEWGVLMGTNPSRFVASEASMRQAGIANTGRYPVESVSWIDSQEMITRLNRLREDKSSTISQKMGTGQFRLPHEDEWEYAVRGGRGNKQAFYFGNSLNGELANCNGRYPYGELQKGPSIGHTTPVGCYENAQCQGFVAQHPWNLCDMVGNVAQWCSNRYDESVNLFVLRGGSWKLDPWDCRSASRSWGDPHQGNETTGVRACYQPE